MPRQIPPIGQPPQGEGIERSGGNPGEPCYEIRESKKGVIEGPYFVLIDSKGDVVYESNVYLGGKEEEEEEFCRDGAERELDTWIKSGRIK